ncbi:MAG: tRNA (adenosine(37)-N6)-dimethylallyltransferase MiaA [Gammaproteobacteria bacterium]|nr:tRNA (adenosine(37)-N6)-dimethylallyltransferase MiaA [Gammaproteobacteria bacterium]
MMSALAVLLMGPTGAGKTDLALKLAERLPVEIVSVDSALVYRGMDLGTAKPDAALRSRWVHHLIDIRDPTENFSAGEFVEEAAQVMRSIWARGLTPLLVGGTMLYFHALTAGIADLPAADARVRAQIDARAAELGWARLHAELAQVDPQAARRIHVNDPQRIQRALEVHRLTGRSISELQRLGTPVLPDTRYLEFALAPTRREDLHDRLAERFRQMMRAGFLEEVRALRARGDLTREHPSMRAVGYRQLWQHLAGECSLERAVESGIAASRQLAKRQLTWLRRRPLARWVDPSTVPLEQIVGDIAAAAANPARGSVRVSSSD